MTTPPHEESSDTYTIMSSGLEEEDSDRVIGKITTHPMRTLRYLSNSHQDPMGKL